MRCIAQYTQQWLAAILQRIAAVKLPICSSGSVILYTCSQEQTIRAPYLSPCTEHVSNKALYALSNSWSSHAQLHDSICPGLGNAGFPINCQR